jgi:outer membrane protein OmpA-like peptidoglycan-associated protein
MGEAFTALSDDANAVSFNPAGLAFNNTAELHTAYSMWFADTYLGFMALQIPSKVGTFALNGAYLGGTPLNRVTNGNYRSGDTFAPTDLAAGLSWGMKVANTFALGLGARSVQETLDTSYSGTAALGDAGILYRNASGVFSFGYAVLNAGGEVKYTGQTTGEKAPLTQRAGIAFRFNMPEHYSEINIALDASKTEGGSPVYSAGIEHIGAKVLSLRLGYRYVTDSKQTKELGSAASLRAGIGLMIKGVGIDYAFQPMSVLGDSHRLALVLKFSGGVVKEVQAGLKVDPEVFSPNGDGIKDGTFFLPEAEKVDKIKSWEITITRADGSIVKKLGGKDEMVPKIVVWDGKDEMGNYISEGKYYVEFAAEAADKKVRSKKMPLIADMTQPDVSLTVGTTYFSPDAAGLANETTFFFTLSDANGIDRWQITVFGQKNGTKPVKKFKSDEYISIGSPTVNSSVIWSGRDEVNDWVVPNGEYNVALSAYDTAGNKKTDAAEVTVYVPPKVEIKVEIKEAVREERGLKVSLASEVLFASAKSELKTAAYPKLDKVIELLNTYPENDVMIEGHTDTAENREKALELSSARGWKVCSYFVNHGIKESRLKVKGYGFDKPIASNKTKKGRAKNRRVEIIILKK